MWRIALLFPFALFANLSALYLSWYDDPTTTMTVQWHTHEQEYGDSLLLQNPNGEWEEISGKHCRLEDLLIHKVTLKSLIPDREYYFRIKTDETIYSFKTAPSNLDKPLKFIVGGDVFTKTKLFRRMGKSILQNNPDFAILSGDITCARSNLKSYPLRRWLKCLKEWKKTMITKENRIIPFIMVPGQKDIAPDDYDLFFTLFAFPTKKLYRSLDFGNYLSLFLLDTGHFHPIEGRQTHWLSQALGSRTQVPYRFAIYPESAYPSSSSNRTLISKKIRSHWIPLFEKYHLPIALEGHNHGYKRTHPIKAGEIDSNGVTYLSDGGWGAPLRKIKDAWYLSEKRKKNSVLLISLKRDSAEIMAIDLLNEPIDQISL